MAGRRKGSTNKPRMSKHDAQIMVAIGLGAHLRNLATEIRNGDTSKLSEFQEMVQYAPDRMKVKLLDWLEETNPKQ